MSVDIETIGVDFDTSGLLSGQREFRNTGRAASDSADAVDRAAGRYRDAQGRLREANGRYAASAREAGSATRGMHNEFSALTSMSGTLRTALLSLGGGLAALEFIKTADAMQLMDARLKLATENVADFEQAQRNVYAIAQKNNVGLQEVASLYTKLADPIRNAGGTMNEVRGIVDAFSTSLRVGGASTQEASAATLQFAQAMASGKLQGDEFRSIAEASPRFMKAIAEGMHVPIGTLKQMSTEGKLTADVIGNALIASLGKLNQEAESLPDTAGGAFRRLRNDIEVAIDDINKASGTNIGVVSTLEVARGMIPTIRDEMIGAFQAVGGWIDQNKDGLGEIWDLTKGLVGDIWGLVEATAEVAGGIGGWGTEMGIFQTILIAARFLVAGFQDGVKFIGAAFAGVGSIIIKAVMMPLQGVLTLSAKVAGLFSEDIAAKIRSINKGIDEFSNAGSDYAASVFDSFAKGDTAVARLADNLGRAQTATDSANNSAKGLSDTYNKLTPAKGIVDKDAVKAANVEHAKQIKLMNELAGLTPTFTEDWNRLTKMYQTHRITLEQLTKAQADLLNKQPKIKQQNEEEKKSLEDANKAFLEYYDNLSKQTRDLQNEAQDEKDRVARIGLTKEAIAELDAQKLEDMAIQKDSNAIMMEAYDLTGEIAQKYRDQAAALRERAAAIRAGATKEQELDHLKAIADANKKMADDLEKEVTDALMKGFDAGKGFAENLRDTVVNMFKTMILRPVIQAIVSPITNPIAGAISGAMGGSAAGTAGKSIDLANAAAMAYKAVTGGFATSGTAAAGGLGSMVSGLGSLTGSTSLQGFGAGLSSAVPGSGASAMYASASASGNLSGAAQAGNAVGSSMGTAVPIIASAVASYMLAKTISGGYKVEGIGNLLNFGGIAGGLLNRAFGMGSKEVTATGLSGTLSGSGVTGGGYTKWHQDGGWLRSDKNGTDRTAFTGDQASQLTQGFNQLKAVSTSFASSLGVSASVLENYSKTFDINLGKDAASAEKAITDFFAGVGDDMARTLIPTIGQLTKAGETASGALQRLSGEFQATNQMAQLLGKTAAQVFGDAGVSSAASRDRLVEMAGGVDALVNNAASFAQNFLSQSEKLAPVQKAVSDAMAAMGLAGVTSMQQFKQVVLGLDLTTEAGAKQYTQMIALADSFSLVHKAVEDERAGLQKQLDDLLMTPAQALAKQRSALDASNRDLFDQIQHAKAMKDAQDAAKSSLSSLVSSMRSFGQSAQSLADSLLTGDLTTLTPEQQYGELRKRYLDTKSKALAGDASAQANYSDVLTSFLQMSQKVNGGDAQYQADFAMGQTDAHDMASWANGQADNAQAQLDAINNQVAGINQLNGTASLIANGIDNLPSALVSSGVDFSTYGAGNTTALVDEIKALRKSNENLSAQVESLKTQQRQDTAASMDSNIKALDQSARAIVTGVSTVLTKVYHLNKVSGEDVLE